MMRVVGLLAAVLLLATTAAPGRADDPAPASVPPPGATGTATPGELPTDEQILKTAKVATDGPGLLDFLRKRVPTEAQQKRVAALIPQLADETFVVRQRATSDLLAVGLPALPQLRLALHDEDAEVRERAREAIEEIEAGAGPAVVAAAVRLIRQRRPAGAVAVLLEYLPYACDEAVGEEAADALLALGVRDGKVDAVLAAALQDRAPERRAAAAVAAGRYGTDEQRAAVRALLTDADARVRFRAAQGLLAARDKSAVPVLAGLLADAPPRPALQALDLLECLAGNLGPRVPLGDSDLTRRRCRDAWENWWKVSGPRVDLAKADVDLPANNPTLQARAAVRQFLDAISTGDGPLFLKTTDVPFTLLDAQAFATRNELDNYFTNALAGGRQKVSVSFKRQLGVGEYARRAPAEQKDALTKLDKPENRAVTVRATFDGQPQDLVLFVRVAAGRAHVIGCGQERGGQPTRP
jgi:HEAT repeat protein